MTPKQNASLIQAARNAAILLQDFAESLSGGGKLEGRSLHLGTNKFYRTLAREFSAKLLAEIDKALGVKARELLK